MKPGRFKLVASDVPKARQEKIVALANDALVCLTSAEDPADVLNATSVLVVSVLRSARVDFEEFVTLLREHWAGTEGPHEIRPLRRDS